jgi:hypothetical protein
MDRSTLEDTDMSRLVRFATPLMAVAMMSSAPMIALAQNFHTENQTDSNATQDWNTPPAGTEQTQHGFRDGIEAAKLDTLAKRKVDAKSSHLYLHPPVKGDDAVNAYRSAFQTGYDAAVKHGVEIIRVHPAS